MLACYEGGKGKGREGRGVIRLYCVLFTDLAQKNDDGHETNGNLPDLGDAIDTVTFGQILEMDESEDDRDFSSSIVLASLSRLKKLLRKWMKPCKCAIHLEGR